MSTASGHGTTFNIYLPASGPAVCRCETPRGLRGRKQSFSSMTKISLSGNPGDSRRVGIPGPDRPQRRGRGDYGRDKGKIDLVILDMIMPGIGGSEVYDRLKEMNPGVVILSAVTASTARPWIFSTEESASSASLLPRRNFRPYQVKFWMRMIRLGGGTMGDGFSAPMVEEGKLADRSSTG